MVFYYFLEEPKDLAAVCIGYRVLLDDAYRRLPSKVGFSEIQIYGDYNFRAYDKTSWPLIVVAKSG